MVPSGLGRRGPQRRRLPARVTPALKKEMVEQGTSANKAGYHYTPGNLGTDGVKQGAAVNKQKLPSSFRVRRQFGRNLVYTVDLSAPRFVWLRN